MNDNEKQVEELRADIEKCKIYDDPARYLVGLGYRKSTDVERRVSQKEIDAKIIIDQFVNRLNVLEAENADLKRQGKAAVVQADTFKQAWEELKSSEHRAVGISEQDIYDIIDNGQYSVTDTYGEASEGLAQAILSKLGKGAVE